MEEIKGTEMQENSKEGFSRFLTYFISICVFSFSLFLLFLLLPIFKIFSGLLVYVIILIFSLALSFLFKFLLDRSKCKTLDFILLPVILSTIGSLGFGFLTYMSSLAQIARKMAMSGIQLMGIGGIVQQITFPNINLIFILFMLFFNTIFIYKYLQSSGEKKYILLYLVPIFCFILISIVINMDILSTMVYPLI